MSKKPRAGGWPKRDLVPLQVRVPPHVAESLARQAAAQVPPISRMKHIEGILTRAVAKENK